VSLRRQRQDTSVPADGPVIRRAAFDLLARREHSAQEMGEKLRQKFGSSAPIDIEIERLLAEGLLDDTRFAEAFTRMHRNRGHGPQRILHELKQRGVDAAISEACVDARSAQWIELARSIRARRFGEEQPPSSADWQRQARHLQTRGFTTDQVRRALRDPDDD
jgi:regulatory protein